MNAQVVPNKYLSALAVTICIFFFWGFAASGNALLIPVLKEQFALSQFQSQLVELSFYLAYFAGSLIYFFISVKGGHLIEQLGTKKIMITGLLLSATGTLLLVWASGTGLYPFLLVALFIIALGFALQQIIANPLLVRLGGELFGAHKLILAGAVNSFGNTIAPLVLSFFIFGALSVETTNVSVLSLKPLFIVIACLYVLFAFFFFKIDTPPVEKKNTGKENGLRLAQYPQLLFGMIAIFCYVGSEVTLQSNLPALVASPAIMGLPAREAVHYFSLFGGSLLIGRCTGAIFNFNIGKSTTKLALLLIPFLTFGLVLFVNWLKGSPLPQIIDYGLILFLLIIALFISGNNTRKILLLSAVCSILLILASFAVSGKWSMYCIIGAASFSALMWPCIFALSINGLGHHTQQGSSLLIMMILGGAIVPPLQGALSDLPYIGIHASFLLPVICLLYILWFAMKQPSLQKTSE